MESRKINFLNAAKANEGFTLVETMIALLIFTFGVLGVSYMTGNATRWIGFAKTSTLEVSRTTLNIETLKQVGYENDDIFKGTAGQTPIGADAATVDYSDTDGAVVRGTKLIAIRNFELKGKGPGGNFVLYYTKPEIQ